MHIPRDTVDSGPGAKVCGTTSWDGRDTWAEMPGSAVEPEGSESSWVGRELRPILTISGNWHQPGSLVMSKGNNIKGKWEGTVTRRTLSCFAKNTGFPGYLEDGQKPHPPKKWERTTGNTAGKSSSYSRNSGCGLELKKAPIVTQVRDFSAAAVAGVALEIRTLHIRCQAI